MKTKERIDIEQKKYSLEKEIQELLKNLSESDSKIKKIKKEIEETGKNIKLLKQETMKEILKEVKNIFKIEGLNDFGINSGYVKMSSRLREDLGFDEMGIRSFIHHTEDGLKITLPDDETLEKMTTIEDFISLVYSILLETPRSN